MLAFQIIFEELVTSISISLPTLIPPKALTNGCFFQLLTHLSKRFGPAWIPPPLEEASPRFRLCLFFLSCIELCCSKFLCTCLVWDNALLCLLVVAPNSVHLHTQHTLRLHIIFFYLIYPIHHDWNCYFYLNSTNKTAPLFWGTGIPDIPAIK